MIPPVPCPRLQQLPAQLRRNTACKRLPKSTASILLVFVWLVFYLDGKGVLKYPGSLPAPGLTPHNSLLLAINCTWGKVSLSPIFQLKKHP